MIELTNDGNGLITFKSEKSRSEKPFDTRYFRLVEQESSLHDPMTDEVIRSAVLVPTRSITNRYKGCLKQHDYDVLDVLDMPYFAGEAYNKEIAEQLKVNPSRVTESVNKLLEQNYVSRRKEGRYTFIVLQEKGRTAIKAHIEQTSAPPEQRTNDSDEARTILNWRVTVRRNDSEPIQERTAEQNGKNNNPFGRFGNDSDPSELFDNDSFGFPPLKGGTDEESKEVLAESSAPASDLPSNEASGDRSRNEEEEPANSEVRPESDAGPPEGDGTLSQTDEVLHPSRSAQPVAPPSGDCAALR